MAQAYIIDTETTGINNPEVIELAYVGVDFTFAQVKPWIEAQSIFERRYKPLGTIEYGAMATHHILPEDLEDCDPSSYAALPPMEYMIGHGIDYDWEVMGKPSVKRICTLAMARRLWPDDSHKLGAMMYRISTDKQACRELLQDAHSAKADCEFCMALLIVIIERLHEIDPYLAFQRMDWEWLWQYSESCRVPDVIGFGKHKGERFNDLPRDYLVWLLNKCDTLDDYGRTAVQRALNR